MATCSVPDLVSASNCFSSCTQGSLATAVELSLLAQILKAVNPMANCDVQSLVSSASCFMCLSVGEANAVRLQLLCEILQGGGGSDTCIVCVPGNSVPTATPACPCALAHNMIGQFWYWNSVTSAWIPYIV
jgi:hypothetical protein